MIVRQSVKITAVGTYPKELPQNLRDGLEEAIRRHMEQYGLKVELVTITDLDEVTV